MAKKWCKYYLVINGRIKEMIVTRTLNRECVLVNLIKAAGMVHFRIILIENKVQSILLDSTKDKNFIKFLYENSRQA